MSKGRPDNKAKSQAERVMSTARAAAVRTLSDRQQAPSLVTDIAELFQNLARALFDPYRPELHYMRGPGPKWRAKHVRSSMTFQAMPALVPVRIKR
jgi:hypothetical protein